MVGASFYIITVSLCWIFLGMITIRKYFDAPFIFFSMSAVFIILPMFYHLLFEPIIPQFFMLNDPEGAYLKQALIILFFGFGLLLGYLFTKSIPLGLGLFPNYRYKRIKSVEVTGFIILFIGSAAVLMPFLSALGNIFSTVDAIRHQDTLEGLTFLKQFSLLGSYLCSAFLLNLYMLEKEGKPQPLKILIIFLFICFLLASSLFGGKAAIVYPLFIFFLGYALCVKRAPLRSMLIPFIILLLLVPALQYARFVYVQELQRVDPQQVVESALTANLMYSNLKYLEVLEGSDLQNMGEDFYNGIVGIIPRFIWPDKPETISVGGRFRQEVNPEGSGGWPVLGYNQWYSNFSWIGVIIGGFVTGWVLRLLQKRYYDLDTNPYSLVLSSVFTIVFTLRAGIDNGFLIKYILFVIPFFLFKMLTSSGFYPKSVLRQSSPP
jgi:oligosaccharide repeat unit polymerase